MPTMTKLEVIDEMESEGYDYDSAWYLVYGDVPDTDFTNPNETDEAV